MATIKGGGGGGIGSEVGATNTNYIIGGHGDNTNNYNYNGLVLLGCAAIVGGYWGWWWMVQRWKKIGPFSVPYLGGVIFHAINFHRIHDSITDYCRTFKTFRAPYPSVDYLYTVDPDNVQYILKTNFHNYIKVI